MTARDDYPDLAKLADDPPMGCRFAAFDARKALDEIDRLRLGTAPRVNS